MAFKIAPDVPQQVLDAMNRIDFKKVSSVTKIVVLKAVKGWADSHLKLKDPKKTYAKSAEKKRITADFDPKLLELLNKYDYTIVSPQGISEMVNMINQYVGGFIPAKQ